MQVRVHRVSSMPLGVQLWVKDTEDGVIIYILKSLISELGALLLSEALSENVDYWSRQPVVIKQPRLRVHTG